MFLLHARTRQPAFYKPCSGNQPRTRRFGRKVHDFERQSHLTAKQHKVQGETSRWLDCWQIRGKFNAEVEVSIFIGVRDVEDEQLDQRTVHSLNLAIALRVVGGCVLLFDV